MANVEVEEFAKVLVREVRDAAIKACDRALDEDAQSPVARRWRRARAPECRDLAKLMIADCVDQTLARLMDAIDQEVLQISFRTASGTVVDLSRAGLGELCGWYMGGDGGWRTLYSTERYSDDLAENESGL